MRARGYTTGTEQRQAVPDHPYSPDGHVPLPGGRFWLNQEDLAIAREWTERPP
jgi:hypothetical protein